MGLVLLTMIRELVGGKVVTAKKNKNKKQRTKPDFWKKDIFKHILSEASHWMTTESYRNWGIKSLERILQRSEQIFCEQIFWFKYSEFSWKYLPVLGIEQDCIHLVKCHCPKAVEQEEIFAVSKKCKRHRNWSVWLPKQPGLERPTSLMRTKEKIVKSSFTWRHLLNY